MTPGVVEADFLTLLDFLAPRLRTYPRETVVAEKFEAMVRLGIANTRMKDFYASYFRPAAASSGEPFNQEWSVGGD